MKGAHSFQTVDIGFALVACGCLPGCLLPSELLGVVFKLSLGGCGRWLAVDGAGRETGGKWLGVQSPHSFHMSRHSTPRIHSLLSICPLHKPAPFPLRPLPQPRTASPFPLQMTTPKVLLSSSGSVLVLHILAYIHIRSLPVFLSEAVLTRVQERDSALIQSFRKCYFGQFESRGGAGSRARGGPDWPHSGAGKGFVGGGVGRFGCGDAGVDARIRCAYLPKPIAAPSQSPLN